jgi:small GTP-binding protein
MSESFSFDVFLSHSSKDKAVVRPIAERLKKDGLRVWFDEWVLKAGDSIPAKIEEGLENSRVLVLCMSAQAFGADWPTLESQTFRFRDPLNKKLRFIPLRLDDAPIKGSLAQFLYIKWLPGVREQEYVKLLEACQPPAMSPAVEAPTASKQVAERVIRLAHETWIFAYAFSQDGKRALTGCADKTVRLWDLETGRCLRVLTGHTEEVWSVEWSTDQRRALTGASDHTVRVWDVQTGRCLQVFEGHTKYINMAAWSPDQGRVLSCSGDSTLRLWEVQTGRCLRVFEGHTNGVWALAWAPDQRRVLSGGDDNTLRLWDVKTGRCLRVLEGHTDTVHCVAWSGDEQHALSCSQDKTIRLWEMETGRCLLILEGHTEQVWRVAWGLDERCALSISGDGTARLWDLRTGRCLSILERIDRAVWGLAWNADQHQVLAGDGDGNIHIWDLSKFVAETRAEQTAFPDLPHAPHQVQYANAKVLLVGDTGVGKSGLAERLVHGQFVPTKSSHARQAHVLESQVVQNPGSVAIHRETILWDLAGQPAYRSVHQLSMDDAVLACVVFDARSETNPFEGAAYWSQVLDQARTNTKIKKLIVASRIDRGGLPASKERIEAFVRENGFEQFIPTSALTGEGCEELLEAIRNGIPWDEIPKVTTTVVLAATRDFVAKLKGENSNREQ